MSAPDVLAVLRRTSEGLHGIADGCRNSDLATAMRERAREFDAACAAVADLIRCDIDYDDVTDDARWRALPDERVCELACRYCGDDAATRERIATAVKATRLHALARCGGAP